MFCTKHQGGGGGVGVNHMKSLGDTHPILWLKIVFHLYMSLLYTYILYHICRIVQLSLIDELGLDVGHEDMLPFHLRRTGIICFSFLPLFMCFNKVSCVHMSNKILFILNLGRRPLRVLSSKRWNQ